MATNFYVDPAASGAANGTSWTDAWTTLQTAADTAIAGDIVYCRGTQNITAAIDFNTSSGTYNGGYIKFIGCNASGTNNGEYFVLDGGDNDINGIYNNQKSYIWLENFKLTRCGTSGSKGGLAFNQAGYSDSCVFINVWFHDNNRYGLYGAWANRFGTFLCCKWTSNTLAQIQVAGISNRYVGCVIKDGGAGGVNDESGGQVYVDCIFHNNTTYGLYSYGQITAINCIFDSNGTYGLHINYIVQTTCIGCRFTNQIGSGDLGIYVGANVSSGALVGCYLGNNATPYTANRMQELPYKNVNTNTIGGTDTDAANGALYGGYTDITNDDFNLKSTATLRSQALELP